MAMESSPQRQSRHAAYLKRQEKRWAKRSGPVTTRAATPAELERTQPPQRPGTAPLRPSKR